MEKRIGKAAENLSLVSLGLLIVAIFGGAFLHLTGHDPSVATPIVEVAGGSYFGLSTLAKLINPKKHSARNK